MSEREERMKKFKEAADHEEHMNDLVNKLRDEQLELRERRKDMEIRAAERAAREAEEKAPLIVTHSASYPPAISKITRVQAQPPSNPTSIVG